MLRKVKAHAIKGNEYWYIDCRCGEVLRRRAWPVVAVKNDGAHCRDCGHWFEFDGNDWYCIESMHNEWPHLYGYPIGQGPEPTQKLQLEYFKGLEEQLETLGAVPDEPKSHSPSGTWRSVRDDPPDYYRLVFVHGEDNRVYVGQMVEAHTWWAYRGRTIGFYDLGDDYWQPIVYPEPTP